MYYDPYYILILIGMVISMIASARVNGTFRKYDEVRSRSGMTGAEAARRLLQAQGIYDVSIQRVSGNLTDHYDPRNKVLRLSDSTYGSSSVAAVGVAAHECGHAIQHEENYMPLTLRSALVPVANFGSRFSMLLIIAGLFLGQVLVEAGILLFCAVVLFQVVTLPVEFNASSRALRLLKDNGILYEEEVGMTRKVLGAAALTYVASVLLSVMQLLRLILLYGGRSRRD
ncbi:MAG: zinc metallopeptidase [Lachnospiraceae bacterium]|jgi:Zn-dependent membrane protease YugP|nr:zinc metallopeptidase [Lachnospiraceae bacterium]